MIDLGKINEAENILLDSIDYTNNNEVIEVALFYRKRSIGGTLVDLPIFLDN